ncbi:MAG TPA: hypothetical protein VIN05_04270 [Roseovarius sp.]
MVRGAREFAAQIGKRTILTISEQDATDYTAHWKTLSESGKVTTNYANKQIRYVRQMIDTHLDDIRMPDSKRINVFEKKRVKKLAYDPEDDERKKLPLPETWIRNRLIKDRVLEALEQEASDIAIISAIGGSRASEIYDVPAADIHLDHPIPHIKFRIVLDGPERRELKSKASFGRSSSKDQHWPPCVGIRRASQGIAARRSSLGRLTSSCGRTDCSRQFRSA